MDDVDEIQVHNKDRSSKAKNHKVKVAATTYDSDILADPLLTTLQSQVYEPTMRDTNNIIFIRDELETSSEASRDGGPIFVRALEKLDAGDLMRRDDHLQNSNRQVDIGAMFRGQVQFFQSSNKNWSSIP